MVEAAGIELEEPRLRECLATLGKVTFINGRLRVELDTLKESSNSYAKFWAPAFKAFRWANLLWPMSLLLSVTGESL